MFICVNYVYEARVVSITKYFAEAFQVVFFLFSSLSLSRYLFLSFFPSFPYTYFILPIPCVHLHHFFSLLSFMRKNYCYYYLFTIIRFSRRAYLYQRQIVWSERNGANLMMRMSEIMFGIVGNIMPHHTKQSRCNLNTTSQYSFGLFKLYSR